MNDKYENVKQSAKQLLEDVEVLLEEAKDKLGDAYDEAQTSETMTKVEDLAQELKEQTHHFINKFKKD